MSIDNCPQSSVPPVGWASAWASVWRRVSAHRRSVMCVASQSLRATRSAPQRRAIASVSGSIWSITATIGAAVWLRRVCNSARPSPDTPLKSIMITAVSLDRSDRATCVIRPKTCIESPRLSHIRSSAAQWPRVREIIRTRLAVSPTRVRSGSKLCRACILFIPFKRCRPMACAMFVWDQISHPARLQHASEGLTGGSKVHLRDLIEQGAVRKDRSGKGMVGDEGFEPPTSSM